jgi:hypothetical protein
MSDFSSTLYDYEELDWVAWGSGVTWVFWQSFYTWDFMVAWDGRTKGVTGSSRVFSLILA